jgi:hypothetical protein
VHRKREVVPVHVGNQIGNANRCLYVVVWQVAPQANVVRAVAIIGPMAIVTASVVSMTIVSITIAITFLKSAARQNARRHACN